MRILITGAAGFLGWHTRVRLRATTDHEVTAVDRAQWHELPAHVAGAEAIIHVAGVNRGDDDEVERGNAELAHALADAVRATGSAPRFVYANSVRAGDETPYGTGKAAAATLLADAARTLGTPFVDVVLPNLFGEHGRPRYNSFVATFADAVVRGETPSVTDRPIELLHAQSAAQALIEGLTTSAACITPKAISTTVQGVLDWLVTARDLYAVGDVPALDTELSVDLFNTLRAAWFPEHYPIPLVERSDPRGRLVEVTRAHGGGGQTFVSTTVPGVTRGEHFHLRKVERFAVVGGRARIRLRRIFSDDVVAFDVSGDEPAIIDMPTMWAHNITNTGREPLTTVFWTNELFDLARPDTYPEPVEPPTGATEGAT